MLSTQIKELTKSHHQETEKKVVLCIKNIHNNQDYIDLLKCFYAYFNAVEKAIAPYINNVLPDYKERRDSSYIKADIEELGGTTDQLPASTAPIVNNEIQAMGALYVLEGSIMGGPYIVKMLQQKGIEKGFSFFSGYGAESGKKWGFFTQILNQLPKTETDEANTVEIAKETFKRFGDVFENNTVSQN